MTQAADILELLEKQPVTALDAFKKAKCFCLAERIRDLRELGHNIKTEMITLPNGKRVAKYFLMKKKRKAA